MSARSVRYVFLDAEGTLWRARPGYSAADFWDHATPRTAQRVFALEPRLDETLRNLREKDFHLVLVSRHVKPLLLMLLDAFSLRHLFDEVLVGYHKPALVHRFLADRSEESERGLMVGDTWDADVLPFKEAGHQAFLVNNDLAGAGSIARLAILPEFLEASRFVPSPPKPVQPELMPPTPQGGARGVATTSPQTPDRLGGSPGPPAGDARGPL